jgi:hypothetical protein
MVQALTAVLSKKDSADILKRIASNQNREAKDD